MNGLLPAYFNAAGQKHFEAMETVDSDVFMSSYPKCGTSWMHQICYCLLRMDEHGECEFGDLVIGSTTQVYPDAIGVDKDPTSSGSPKKFGVNDLLRQPRPRLISSHIRAGNLPPSLGSAGKLVMISRNPKDALISAFFFFTKLWKMMEAAGPSANMSAEGFKSRVGKGLEHFYEIYNEVYETKEGQYAYGDYYTWHTDMLKLGNQLGPSRFFSTFYEQMHADFRGEVHRLADFLNVPMTEAKFQALAKRVSFDAMADRKHITARKGVVGDHKEHLTRAHWARMELYFDQYLHREPLAAVTMAPLQRYMAFDANKQVKHARL
jgi:hypothetical protein